MSADISIEVRFDRSHCTNIYPLDRLEVTPSSLRRLADVLDRRAGKKTLKYILIGEIDFWRGQYNTRQELINFLITQHDTDQNRITRIELDNAALRADIAAMQSGEMTI